MDFKDQLKSSLDIVHVVGEYVRLRKSGADRYSGLCPFHNEKTPSFSVHAGKQFYHCFGCHEHGDIFSFIMKIEGVTFFEALTSLAERNGIAVPKRSLASDEESRARAALLEMQEVAQQAFRAALQGPQGEAARAYLDRRGVAPATVETFGLGYAERGGRALLRLLEQRDYRPELLEQSGLVGRRQDGSWYDRFRNRLIFPIHNESGKVIGFGGRALEPDDQPKYLNSPETPIYHKSHVLYNLHRAKDSIRKQDRVILVEGYMDAIGVSAAGVGEVVASCGTALTTPQVQALKRHSQRIVVNFDPDAAGANASEKSIDTLLAESMHVRILALDGGLDPDEYCRDRGADAYRGRLEEARGYFYWLADRARQKHDVHTPEGVRAVLQSLLPALRKIADKLERSAVANDLASYIGVAPGIVLESFREAASERKAHAVDAGREPLRADERGLLHVLLSSVTGREQLLDALAGAEVISGLATRRIFQALASARSGGSPLAFDAIDARLEPGDRNLLAEVLFAEGHDECELTLEYGQECLASLMRSEARLNRDRLKTRIRELEREGRFEDAIALAGQLGQLERNSLPL